MGTQCGRKLNDSLIINEAPRGMTCLRVADHRGRHRNTVAMTRDSFVWGDNECAPEGGAMFTVTITYWSGVEETLPGIDEENARAYLAEAGVSVRVKAAEMRADDGSVASGFQRLRNPADPAPVG